MNKKRISLGVAAGLTASLLTAGPVFAETNPDPGILESESSQSAPIEVPVVEPVTPPVETPAEEVTPVEATPIEAAPIAEPTADAALQDPAPLEIPVIIPEESVESAAEDVAPPRSDDPLLRWYPDGGRETPSFWVALTASPGAPVSDCADPSDVRVSTAAEHGDSGHAYDVIQWDARQSSGKVTFDVVNSDCGVRWGLTSTDAMSAYGLPGTEAALSFNAGVITLDVDVLIAASNPEYPSSTLVTLITRADGSVISVGMNIWHAAPVAPETWSCFTGDPAPVGVGYDDMPAIPDSYSGTGQVGEPLTISLDELAKGTGWITSFLRSGPEGMVRNFDQSLSWTPTAAGTHTFEFNLGAPNCISRSIAGTLTIEGSAVVEPEPDPQPPVVTEPPVVTIIDPAPPVNTEQPAADPKKPVSPELADTGADSGSTSLFAALLLLMAGLGAMVVARRRSALKATN